MPLDRKKAEAKSFASQSRLNEIMGGDGIDSGNGTSIFDPVLCELSYRWFSAPDAKVIDPFAGGSVRGITAAVLGRDYTGIDLRAEQVAANELQWVDIKPSCPKGNDARWITGDSNEILASLKQEYDFIFSCPPYGDLEVYSDDPADLSTMDQADFIKLYRQIIAKACAILKNDRFACFVVGDYRDKRGLYQNFVSETIGAFLDAGLQLYNEAILVTSAGSLPIRAGKQFTAARKLGKTHQNVLVFIKGDAKKATLACGPVEFGEINEDQETTA